MKFSDYVTVVSMVITIIFGAGGMAGYIATYLDRKKFLEQLALERKKYEESKQSAKDSATAQTLNEASLAVGNSAKLLNEQMQAIQVRMDEYEEREGVLLRKIEEQAQRILALEKEQVHYRDLVRSIARELLEELGRSNGAVNTEKLKLIINRFFE